MLTVLVNGAVRNIGQDSSIAEDGRRLKSLEIDYIGIDLNAADRVTYQYMLEGQDREWQEAGPRGEAFYTNLTPAHYRFRVRATNGTGKWTDLRVPLLLTVRPAFYQTTSFSVLCAFGLAVSLWLLYQRRVQYLTSQVQQRMEARAHERLRIARDLHDTLLQGIQGLVLRFHYATEQIKNDDAARDMLRVALSRADQVINEGREKVRELRSDKPRSQELAGQLAELTEIMQAETETPISLVTRGEARPLNLAVLEEIFSIAREALTNAVRHAAAKSIKLELSFERRLLRVVCIDDGKGLGLDVIKAGFKKGHYGILGMRERAMKLGCTLTLASSPGAGTRVEAGVPAKRAYVDKAPFIGFSILDRVSLLIHPERHS
jgi:signal transduction histidine kinase